jgi:hypothetical protein
MGEFINFGKETGRSLPSRTLQLENRHFASNIEAHMQQVADPAADVQAAACPDVELAGSVEPVTARQ